MKEEYLSLVEDWVDPYPRPILEKHDEFIVVRDDLLGYGSKIRFIDALIKSDGDEWVCGGFNKFGWGGISLAYVCKAYGKKATCFMADRKIPTWHQQKVLDIGADIRWVKMGMLSVTESHAKRYVLEDPTRRRLLPSGFDNPLVLASIVKTAVGLDVLPTEVWSAASSGTLSRGLQIAFPNIPVFAVETGHKLSDYQRGRATSLISPYKYDKSVRQENKPPYPSEIYCDAKIWEFVRLLAKPGALIWNVA